MIDFIKSIPGPLFLLLYAVLTGLLIFILKKQFGKTKRTVADLPETTSLSPLDISILAKGPRGAVIFSVFNLWRKKKISVSRSGKKMIIKRLTDDKTGLDTLESAILDKIYNESDYKILFRPQTVSQIEQSIQPNIDFLEEQELLMSKSQVDKNKRTAFLTLFTLLLFGGLKMYLGIVREKPIGGLVFLMIVSVILFFVILKPFRRGTTKLGQIFLANSRRRFEYVKTAKSYDDNTAYDNSGVSHGSSDNTLLYAVSLLGTVALVNSVYGQDFGDAAFLDRGNVQDYNGSGCAGTACGGSSCSGSSCSGSSCSGSSCSGGGCGGCGGGGD